MSPWTFDLPERVDLTGEDHVLGRRYGVGPLLGLTSLPGRASSLAVFRESNEYDLVLMRGLVQHTLSYCRQLKSVEIARELELAPLLKDARDLPEGVNVVRLSHGRAKAVLMEIGGEYYLYSMTSAAKSNKEGDNDWTSLLVGVINALRPVDLYTASLSRLVRAFDHSSLVLHAVSRSVDRVHAGSTVITMSGEGQETGHIMWSTLAMVAASERNLIVQRLTAGVVAKYRRGEWIKGRGAVLPGYVLDEHSKNLRPDPTALNAVRKMWAVLADASIPNRRVVQLLGQEGFTTPTAQKRHGPSATVSDLHDHDVFVRKILRWAPTYLTGRHTTEWRNPFKGAPHIAGLPVIGATDEYPGHMAMPYDWGRLDLDPAVINTALAVRRQPSPDGAAGKSLLPPLNDMRWVQDGLEFLLVGERADTYQIRMRGAQ